MKSISLSSVIRSLAGPFAVVWLLFVLASCGASRESTGSVETVAEPSAEDAAFNDRGDLRLVFYNVENLFDTVDDSLTIDEEFLPWGIKGWNTSRYEDKLQKIFKVVVNTGGWELPELIGLCEIENRFVLEDLLKKTPLSRGRYGIIHEDSPDARGIDLGFLYRRDHFTPLRHQAIRIGFPFEPETKTRDVLYVEGRAESGDTLHIFLCHFPSRRGGQAVSEPKRLFVAGKVREKVDSILTAQPGAHIVVTGDFNDMPSNRSILEGLLTTGDWKAGDPAILYNFMAPMEARGLGTYKYQGAWNLLDQVMVSAGLLEQGGDLYVKPNSAQIFQRPWLTEDDPDAPGGKPFRTYGGAYYYGGYSDHYPVFLDLFFSR